jgi:hypothetical protein
MLVTHHPHIFGGCIPEVAHSSNKTDPARTAQSVTDAQLAQLSLRAFPHVIGEQEPKSNMPGWQ